MPRVKSCRIQSAAFLRVMTAIGDRSYYRYGRSITQLRPIPIDGQPALRARWGFLNSRPPSTMLFRMVAPVWMMCHADDGRQMRVRDDAATARCLAQGRAIDLAAPAKNAGGCKSCRSSKNFIAEMVGQIRWLRKGPDRSDVFPSQTYPSLPFLNFLLNNRFPTSPRSFAPSPGRRG